jgi:uncharacterized secreted repeat protein (TIGR03808 family)
MTLDRRSVLSAGLGAGLGSGLGAGLIAAVPAQAGPRRDTARPPGTSAARFPADLGLEPGSARDQTAALQQAIDEAANRGVPLNLPAGRYRASALELRPGTKLIGAARTTALEFVGGEAFLTGEAADDVLIEDLVLDGAYKPLTRADALLSLRTSRSVTLRGLDVVRSPANGITLEGCAGKVSDCTVSGAIEAGLRSLDAGGLDIVHNAILDCANNGIQVWRSDPGEDGSIVANNRIARIRADGGGSGENGNGVSVFRAGGVLVTGNRIADCAYSAVRGNAAANIQMIANACARLGEVALYAEFGFEGALIANNLVDAAATGVSVTNFNEGGRLAIVQGNILRNLFRREEEPEDKRGEGITVEADTIVTGNVIENAPTAGLVIGWGRYVREVVATGNLIRKARVGILVSADAGSGACLIANNMIAGAADGGIRSMDAGGRPVGPDLARADASDKRLSLIGNLVV